MNVDLIFRLIGMITLAGLGLYSGVILSDNGGATVYIYAGIGALVGAVLGWVFTPLLTIRPARALRNRLSKIPTQTLLIGLVGLIVGLIIAALLSIPLSSFPQPFGSVFSILAALLITYLSVALFITRQHDITDFLHIRSQERASEQTQKDAPPTKVEETEAARTILLDTSVIIDGRIADVARTGFLVGSLLIPRFVLNELQYIADSADGLRRQRGRRGMEVLSQLQKDATLPVKISDLDVEGVREVDDKLVTLARQLLAPILTNDYNLNRVAELQGVKVLNINDLANAVKTVLLPGETLLVHLIQEGRESGQGIAYLDDGTMVVVEDGRGHIGEEVTATVTKVLQTSAGRMIFSRLGNGV